VVLARDSAPDDASSETVEGDPRTINGNAIVIDHGGGWQTRYNHLKQGSLRVRVGEDVPRGAVLAQVGLSGQSNYPHLHFEVIYLGTRYDPFSGRGLEDGCKGEQHSLWHEHALERLPTTLGGLLDSGFSSEALSPDQIRDGPARLLTAQPATERLFFWASAWALRAGDSDIMTLVGPNGATLALSKKSLMNNHHDWVRSIGVTTPKGGWPKGRYIGTYRAYRGEASNRELIIEVKRTIEVN
jgi:hypothetical protein